MQLHLLALLGLLSCSFQVGEPRGAELGVQLVSVLQVGADYERPIWFGPLPGSKTAAGAEHVLGLQEGQVMRVTFDADGRPSGEPQLWFDLQDAVSRRGNEEGLLGLAFHPDYPADPRLFVHLSSRGEPRGQIWELNVGGVADAHGIGGEDDEHEETPMERLKARLVFEVAQPFRNHNGGEIVFGDDRMLYVGLGDGGAAGDPHRAAQDMGNLLGKILRIDVLADAARFVEGTRYAIPADNPFVERAGARGEIWALGLRNPWRFCFDPTREGAIWVADVGQNRFEEIDFVEAGGNYGWSCREGFAPFDAKTKPATETLLDPVIDYPRSQGGSVTGGFVYTGRALPVLVERYLYADYASGAIWAIDADPVSPGEPDLLAKIPGPASFGRDAWGEIYVLSFDGQLYRFAPAKSGP